MDRDKRITRVFLFLALLGTAIITSVVVAAPASVDTETPAKNSQQLNSSSGIENSLSQQFPSLQRALIIATMINFVIIVFALLLYFVKRRMNQFSPGPIRMQQDN